MLAPANEIISRTRSNLEQLAKLVHGQKLVADTKRGYLNIDTSSFPAVTRYINGQDRGTTIDIVTENIKLCMQFIVMIYDVIIFKRLIPDENCDDAVILVYQEKVKLYKDLIDALCKATSGLNALLGTYGYDPAMSTVLNKLTQEIGVFTTQHKAMADKL